ncbi:hypothetical protein BpHYR1_028603 [Brachionus plicatilis]|uniref:Uncharacterized protein n=1 Tax=Brachionus plicatilis TaxID=10195 RepID=A0A3M7QR38_BRAPC|nr:hypothetical protein BpHYR1_028603 [Brachionus plicatilis]
MSWPFLWTFWHRSPLRSQFWAARRTFCSTFGSRSTTVGCRGLRFAGLSKLHKTKKIIFYFLCPIGKDFDTTIARLSLQVIDIVVSIYEE